MSVFGPTNGGLVAGGDPFGGATGFGFEIPQGDPGELDALARACGTQATTLSGFGQDVAGGARVATAAWRGPASGAFVSYAGHVVSVFDANAEAFGEAGRALSTFARELADAQRATREALRECDYWHGQMTTARNTANQQAQRAQSLNTQAAAAVHPQVQSALTHQAGLAQGEANAANIAADTAQGQFQAAQRHGILAWERYQHESLSAARLVQAAAERVQMVERLPGGVAPLLAAAGAPISAAGGIPLASVFANPLSPFSGMGLAPGDILPGGPVTPFDAYGMLAGGLSGGMSQWARDRITQLEYAPRLFSRLSSMDQILSDPLSSTAAREYAQSTINALSGEIAALPEQSLPGLQRIVNFSDHFVGGVLGGGIDTVVHLAQGQNVVDSVGSGAMSAGFGYAGGAFGGGACAAFVVTAEAAPLCAMGGAAVGGFIGDKIAPPVIHFVEGLLP